MARAGRRWLGLAASIVLALSTPAALQAQTIPGAIPQSAAALAQGEWPAYAGTYAAARYSPLTQINKDNAKNLRVAWRWKSPARPCSISGASGRRRPAMCAAST